MADAKNLCGRRPENAVSTLTSAIAANINIQSGLLYSTQGPSLGYRNLGRIFPSILCSWLQISGQTWIQQLAGPAGQNPHFDKQQKLCLHLLLLVGQSLSRILGRTMPHPVSLSRPCLHPVEGTSLVEN